MTYATLGIPPGNFVYERRASTISNPVLHNTSGYELMRWVKPSNRSHFLLYGIGTDQHPNSYYEWTVDGIVLPISGEARVGSPEEPYMFPEPIIVSGSIVLKVTNGNPVDYPRVDSSDPDAEYSYECVVVGRYS